MIVSYVYSVFMLLVCIFVNQFSYFLFGYDSLILDIITPINEETARLISVVKGPPLCWAFTALIAFYEFITYLISINDSGNLSASFIFIRVVCVILHFSLLFIQLYGKKLSEKKKKKIYLVYSYCFTITFHFMWNGIISKIVVPLLIF